MASHPAAPTSSRSGADPTGSVVVTADADGRIVRVDVARLDDGLRESGAVDLAVRGAYLAARVTRRADRGTALPRATGPGPRPARLVLTNPWTEGREVTMSDHEWGLRIAAADLGPVTGTSDNDCVAVTLRPGSSIGTVTADAGWLRHAAPANLGAALTQAFDHAYRKRDGR